MGEEYRGKVFKSGNSLALRLPKGLGAEEGAEMRLVRETPTSFRAEPLHQSKRKFNIDKVWGCAKESGLQLIQPEDRVFEERRLDWTGDRLTPDDRP